MGASEYTATSGAVQCVRNYTVGDEPVATRDASGLTVIIGDSQHTGQLAINGTTLAVDKRRFAPFGTDLDDPTSAWPNSHGYLDKTTDSSTGTTHLGAREYDPQLGRFLSVDSVLDTGDPQQMNGYAYANNSPITSTDPTGKLFAPGDGRVPTCGTGRTCRDNGYTPVPKHVWDGYENRHVPTPDEIHAAIQAALKERVGDSWSPLDLIPKTKGQWAGLGVAVLVGGCVVATAGVCAPIGGGVLAASVLSGGASAATTYLIDSHSRSVSGTLLSTGEGALTGAITHGLLKGLAATNIGTLRTATGGRNVVNKTPSCTTRYCFGGGHGMNGPHVHETRIIDRGPQGPSVRPMTGRDAKDALALLRSGQASLGNARRR